MNVREVPERRFGVIAYHAAVDSWQVYDNADCIAPTLIASAPSRYGPSTRGGSDPLQWTG
jgi:hypothetical protein